MAAFTTIAKTSDIPVGSGKCVEVNGKPIAVFNVDGAFHAIHNTCLHRGGPLGEGSLDGTTVTCPWHGWEYEVTSGACLTAPNTEVERFEVKVEGDDVLVAV